MRVRYDFPLTELNTMRLRTPAGVFITLETSSDLDEFLQNIESFPPIFVVGSGSNTLFTNEVANRAVIKLGSGFRFVRVEENVLRCGAATPSTHVASIARRNGISGLEFLACIPGTIGGALKMNAGCYGHYIAGIFESATIRTIDGRRRELKRPDVDFTPRCCKSIYENEFIVEVVLRGSEDNITKIKNRMKSYLSMKIRTQPIWENTLGSTFLSPINIGDLNQPLRVHDVLNAVGLESLKYGDATLSPQNHNFILCGPNTVADDVMKMVRHIEADVFEKRDIRLKLEIILV